MSINPTNYSEWTEAKSPDPCEVLSHPYPFTTYHEMSLGWFLQQWKEFLKNYEESKEAISGITADAETVPYTEPATVIVTGGEGGEPYHLHFKIPQSEPGQGGGDVKSVNHIPPDESGDIIITSHDIPTPEFTSITAALAAKVDTSAIIDITHGGTGATTAQDAREALQVVGKADALTLEEIAASTDLTGKVASASAVKNSIIPKRFIMQGTDRFAIDYDQSYYITEKSVALIFTGHFIATGDGNSYCRFPTGTNAISGAIFGAGSGGRWTLSNVRYCYVNPDSLTTIPISTVGEYLHINAVIRLQ